MGSLTALLLTVASLVLPGQTRAQEIDLTGEWLLTVESPNGTGQRDLTLVQEGSELTGEIMSSRAGGDLTGTIDGNEITFIAVVYMESGSFDITYRATLEDGVMKGTVDFGDYGSGTFTGKRVEG
jgi:hypothetical protein